MAQWMHLCSFLFFLPSFLHALPVGNSTVEHVPTFQFEQKSFAIQLIRDQVWYGLVGVGTPAQTMKVLFDTGSADFWVRSRTCKIVACRDKPGSITNFMPTTAYNPHLSSSFQLVNETMQSVVYGTGAVALLMGEETVSFPSLDQGTVSVKNQDLGLTVYMSEFPFSTLNFDGILGLGFNNLAINGTETPMNNMKRQGIIGQRILGYFIGRNTSAQASTTPLIVSKPDGSKVYVPATDQIGEITIGGYNDKRLNSSIDWVPLSRAKYWQVDLVGLRYGDEELLDTTNGVASDEFSESVADSTSFNETTSDSTTTDISADTTTPPLSSASSSNSTTTTPSIKGSKWPFPAVVDTGTTLIILPDSIGKKLKKKMGAWYIKFLKFRINNMLVDCGKLDKLKPITFSFQRYNGNAEDRVELTLQPQDYIFQAETDDLQEGQQTPSVPLNGTDGITPIKLPIPFVNRCFTMFDMNSGKSWGGWEVSILGEGLLRHFYSVWDEENERIGFARVNPNADI